MARLRPSTEGADLARIRAYEAAQRDVCATANAQFDPPDYLKLTALAPSVVAGHLPARGTRHIGETVEWYILADDEPAPPIEELSLQHLHHLATLREDLVMYLALPVGWSFAVMADGQRSWAAFAPSDQLSADVDAFLSTGGSARSAELIKGILDESFPDVPAARELARLMSEYLQDGRQAGDLEARLRGITAIVRDTPGDHRLAPRSPSTATPGDAD